MSAIQADYRTFKHIPSRKCYQLIMEISEESFPSVCGILGYPATGENTFVGIALLDKSIVTKPQSNCDRELSEGEKIRTRAVMLCDDSQFQLYSYSRLQKIRGDTWLPKASNEDIAKEFLYFVLSINSRAELATNTDAQLKFIEVIKFFNEWKVSNRYADNLSRG